MKIDMSPRAVTERLRTLNDLWLLSVKLMNSKKVKSAKVGENATSRNDRNSGFKREPIKKRVL